MNIDLIRRHIIVPALDMCGINSQERVDLVFFTGAVESLYKTTRQYNGPARGWFQMEEQTHNDIWDNFLVNRKRHYIADGLHEITSYAGDFKEIENNPFYAAAMCGVHYMRFPEALPIVNDRLSQAVYWKQYYNTYLGKGTIDDALNKIESVMSEH